MKGFTSVLVLLALLAVLGSGCKPKGSEPDETNTRLLQISAPADATGSGWVDVYVPAKQPGADHFSCFLEPGSAPCIRYVDPTKTFELVATAQNLSTFVEWGQDCSGTDASCGKSAAGEGEVDVYARFKGELKVVYFDVETDLDTAGGVLTSDKGHGLPIPWWQGAALEALPDWEFLVPAGGSLMVTFTAEPLPNNLVEYLGVKPEGGLFACGGPVSTCTITLAGTGQTDHYVVRVVFKPCSAPSPCVFIGGGAGLTAVTPTSVAPTATPSTSAPPPPTPTPPSGLNVSGNWTLTVDVTRANGVCAGEENDPIYTETVTIAQSGSTLTVTGIDGATGTWQGSIQGNQVTFGGMKRDGSGNTTASFSFQYTGGNTMNGTEAWSWEGNSGSCPNGASSVVATRS